MVVPFNIDILSITSDHSSLNERHLNLQKKTDEFERLMHQTKIDKLLNLDMNCADIIPTEVYKFSNIFSNALHVFAILHTYWKK